MYGSPVSYTHLDVYKRQVRVLRIYQRIRLYISTHFVNYLLDSTLAREHEVESLLINK